MRKRPVRQRRTTPSVRPSCEHLEDRRVLAGLGLGLLPLPTLPIVQPAVSGLLQPLSSPASTPADGLTAPLSGLTTSLTGGLLTPVMNLVTGATDAVLGTVANVTDAGGQFPGSLGLTDPTGSLPLVGNPNLPGLTRPGRTAPAGTTDAAALSVAQAVALLAGSTPGPLTQPSEVTAGLTGTGAAAPALVASAPAVQPATTARAEGLAPGPDVGTSFHPQSDDSGIPLPQRNDTSASHAHAQTDDPGAFLRSTGVELGGGGERIDSGANAGTAQTADAPFVNLFDIELPGMLPGGAAEWWSAGSVARHGDADAPAAGDNSGLGRSGSDDSPGGARTSVGAPCGAGLATAQVPVDTNTLRLAVEQFLAGLDDLARGLAEALAGNAAATWLIALVVGAGAFGGQVYRRRKQAAEEDRDSAAWLAAACSFGTPAL